MEKKDLLWVTHPSRFAKNGRVHQATCRYADTTHGDWVEAEKVWDKDAAGVPILDCKSCGGREAKV
jgi:hypothetical protein